MRVMSGEEFQIEAMLITTATTDNTTTTAENNNMFTFCAFKATFWAAHEIALGWVGRRVEGREGTLQDIVSCTACGSQVNHFMKDTLFRHPVLKTLICKSCYKYYTSDDINQDEEGMDEQCRWCAEGGNLLCCDFCHNAFCKSCVLRNLGRRVLRDVVSSSDVKWACFVCDPAPLVNVVAACNAVFESLELRGKRRHQQHRQPQQQQRNDRNRRKRHEKPGKRGERDSRDGGGGGGGWRRGDGEKLIEATVNLSLKYIKFLGSASRADGNADGNADGDADHRGSSPERLAVRLRKARAFRSVLSELRKAHVALHRSMEEEVATQAASLRELEAKGGRAKVAKAAKAAAEVKEEEEEEEGKDEEEMEEEEEGKEGGGGRGGGKGAKEGNSGGRKAQAESRPSKDKVKDRRRAAREKADDKEVDDKEVDEVEDEVVDDAEVEEDAERLSQGEPAERPAGKEKPARVPASERRRASSGVPSPAEPRHHRRKSPRAARSPEEPGEGGDAAAVAAASSSDEGGGDDDEEGGEEGGSDDGGDGGDGAVRKAKASAEEPSSSSVAAASKAEGGDEPIAAFTADFDFDMAEHAVADDSWLLAELSDISSCVQPAGAAAGAGADGKAAADAGGAAKAGVDDRQNDGARGEEEVEEEDVEGDDVEGDDVEEEEGDEDDGGTKSKERATTKKRKKANGKKRPLPPSRKAKGGDAKSHGRRRRRPMRRL
ncbi:unnamed protein product [Lampetra fluviatilis]